MAVTNLKDVHFSERSLPLRRCQGNGSPIGDTVLGVDANYPINSEYVDLDTGYKYRKKSTGASGWVAIDRYKIVDVIVATAVSQTTDFGILKDGDVVLGISDDVTEANEYIAVTTDGDLGTAAVVDHFYIVLRAIDLNA